METLAEGSNYTKKSKYIVLSAAVGVNLLAGFIYTWSVLSKALIKDFGWTSSQASLPYTMFTLSFVIAMVVFGKVQDIKGPRLVASLGCLFMGSGLILSGIFILPMTMAFTIGIITGLGVGMVTVATIPPAVKWFSASKKGMVTGLVSGGASLSSVYYSPLANFLISRIGLEKTFIFFGVVVLIVTTTISQALRNPPSEFCLEEDNRILNCAKLKDYTWKEMLKTLNFYKVWLMFAFSSAVGLMIIGHIASIANLQVKWEASFVLVIIFSIFSTIGRLSGGTISDKIGRMNLMKITFSLQAVNMLFFNTYKDKWSLILGAAIAGFSYGTAFTVFPATISDLFGTKNFGVNYGLMFTGWGLGGIIGPMMGAKIYDTLNSYYFAYMISFILLVVSIAISSRLKIVKE